MSKFTKITLLSIKQVTELTMFSKSWVYSKVSEGEFPAFIKIGRNSRWKYIDIEGWILKSTS